ncbi:MAG: ABC transporter ATP-binding protein [Anaerolineae bacterium]|nr:ABC transporter ATP-binding protein [Anaerolineae bacterium]
MNRVLELQDITKVFHLGSMISRLRITAVDHVSFHVGSAEIFGLAGESGCGKTTIARMILGFEEPTSGQIIYRKKDGTPVTGKEVWRTAGVQAVFQNPFETFNPLRQVERYFFEAVHNFRLASSHSEAVARINKALEAVGLSYKEIAGRYPAEFSGGQLQRVSIARSLLTEPSLLIADEPVSMVDASIRMSIMNLFRELVEKFGVSVLYITHDLATAYYVCDRIAIMLRGNIVAMGDVEKVLVKPRHPYVELLRECIPETDPRKRWAAKVQLAESEQEEYLRAGCKFAGRCPHVMERCQRESPKDILVDGVLVKCFLYS